MLIQFILPVQALKREIKLSKKLLYCLARIFKKVKYKAAHL